MKNWLKNTLMAGSFLAGGLSGFSQNSQSQQDKEFSKWLSQDWKLYKTEVNEAPRYCSSDSSKDENKTIDFKEAREKLDAEGVLMLRNLGHGYVTSRENNTLGDRNYQNIRTIEGVRDGSVELESNGKKSILNGTLYGNPSEETLAYVDCIEKDKILTPNEISETLNKEKQKAFLDYASKTLGVPEDSLVGAGEHYVTSKDLEGLLNATSNVFESLFNKKREALYDYISKEDAVLTEKEVLGAAKAMENYLEKRK